MIAWLVETLVATTGLMLLVLLIREPVRRLFGAHVAYALWLLPALRMVLPPLGALLPDSVQLNAMAETSSAVGAIMQSGAVTQIILDGDPATPAAQAAGAGAAWPLLLAALWTTGLVLFAVHQYLAYRRFCGFILSEATLREELAPGVTLVSSPRARGPMAFGLRRRFVVFPADADQRFDAEERAMALAHELAHHSRGDLVANAVALVILTLHWCNPVAWIAYRAFRTDQEIACDADVIAGLRGSALGHAYGRALVKSASGREFAAACNLTTVDRLKRRLVMLASKSPSVFRRRTGLMLAGTVILGGLLTTASGESMAAQVGARVSEALPIPQFDSGPVQALLPSLPAASAASVLPVARATEQDEKTRERRVERIVIVTTDDDGDLAALAPPPTPPAPPAPGVAPTPPTPPAPPVALSGRPHVHVVRSIHRDGKPIREDILPPAPMAGVELVEACEPGREPVSRSEEKITKDGKTRTVTRVQICRREIARQADAARAHARVMALHARDARRHAVSSLREAREEMARDRDIAEKDRAEILADLDRTIARIEARKTDD